MDEYDVVQALKRSSKGQLFNKTISPNNSDINSSSGSCEIAKKNFKAEKRSPSFVEKSVSFEKAPKHATSEHESSLNQSKNSLENYSFTDLLLQASNDEINEKVTVFVTNKQREFEEKDKELHQNTFLCEKIIAEEVRKKYLQTEAEEKEFEKIYVEKLENNQKMLKERHHRHAKLLDRQNMEAKSEIQERESRKTKQQEKFKNDLKKEVEGVMQMDQLLTTHIFHSGLFDKMPPALKNAPQIMKHIIQKILKLSEKGELSQDDLNMASSLSSEARKMLSIVAAKTTELKALEDKQAEQIKPNQAPQTKDVEHSVKQAADSKASNPGSKNAHILVKGSRDYYRHLQMISDTEDSLKDLNENSNNKELKGKLSKFILETLSTLDDQTTLMGFNNKLSRLFEGEVVDLPGGEEFVSIKDHPSAGLFCMSRLAKKFVVYGEKSKSSENANSLATLAASLWKSYPVFGDLFLAHMAIKCPFSVPYFGDNETKSDIERYRFLGYNVVAGELEKEDIYLKRISNIISFYGSVLMAKPLQQNISSVDAYRACGVRRAWEWLAMALSNDPIIDISAAIIHSFLTSVTKEMSLCYGRQFQKMLLFIENVYFARLKQVCQKDNITKHNLVEFLEKSLGRKILKI